MVSGQFYFTILGEELFIFAAIKMPYLCGFWRFANAYIDNCMWGGTLKWTGESKEVGHGIFQATFKGKLKKLS